VSDDGPQHDFTFLGAVSAADSPRELVRESFVELERMNIRVILASAEDRFAAAHMARLVGYLTQDTVEVPSSLLIARKCLCFLPHMQQEMAEKKGVSVKEIDPRSSSALVAQSSAYLSELTSNEFDDALLKRELIFCNISPKQKALLVDHLRTRGDLVVTLPEGPDDVPCLRKTDLAFSFASCSDICKEASSFIITDDAFSNVVYGLAIGSDAKAGRIAEKEQCTVM
jgi:magnesium-transporting ATPase (P-type)